MAGWICTFFMNFRMEMREAKKIADLKRREKEEERIAK